MTPTPTSGAADLRTAAQAVVDRWDTPLWKDVPATAEYIGRLRAALAAGQATAAQQGAAYAALPTSSHAGRVYEEGFLIGTCPLYTADQLRAFADATHTLRASHGQAPAETGNSVSAQTDSVQEDAAWMPLTPELLTAIESGDLGNRFWIAAHISNEPQIGVYEWQQGRSPHGFNSDLSRYGASEITHVLPYKPPALPEAIKQGASHDR